MRGPPKLISLLSSSRGLDWKRDQLSPHGWRARKDFDLTIFVSHLCPSGELLSRLFEQIEHGLASSVLLSTTIRAITVVKILWTHELTTDEA